MLIVCLIDNPHVMSSLIFSEKMIKSVVSSAAVVAVIIKKSRNWLNDHKVPDNINYTIVKYGET